MKRPRAAGVLRRASLSERLEQSAQAFSRTLRTPNLRRAQLSFGCAWAGDWAVTVALGILAFRNGGAAAVGIVGMARVVPAALLAPVAAVLADRHRRERVLAGVGLVRCAALGGAALAVAGDASPVAAYGLVAVASLAHTLYRPAHSALLPSICTTTSQLTDVNGVRGLLDSLSALVGPLLAGLLVGPIGVAGVFAVSAATALWSAVLIRRVVYEAPPRLADVVPAKPIHEAIDGAAFIARRGDVGVLTLLGCLQTFIRGAFAVFAVVVSYRLLALGEAGVGVLTASFGAGAVLGSFFTVMLVRSSGFGGWLAVGVTGWGVPFAVLAAVSGEAPALVLVGVVGLCNTIVDVAYFTLLQRLIPDELMGRVFVADESLLTFAVGAGSLATPGLIALFGVRGALLSVGLLAPLGVLAALPTLRRLDSRMQTADADLTFLQQLEMLKPLPLATISVLASGATADSFPSHTVVVAEGTIGDDFYVITKGHAEVLVAGAHIGELHAADCFGEIAALTGSHRTATVRASSTLSVLRLSGRQFARAVTGYTPSGAVAATLISDRLARGASTPEDAPTTRA